LEVLSSDDARELARLYLTCFRDESLWRGRPWGERNPSEEVAIHLMKSANPLPLVDLLLEEAAGDEAAISFIGAGPVEDLIYDRPELWEKIDDRCRQSAMCAEAASGTWIDEDITVRLPEHLASLVIRLEGETQPTRVRKKHSKRPSKRQDRRGRRAGG